jgi:hypothetical protein
MRVAPEHGEVRKEPGQGSGDLSLQNGFLLENTDLRISVEHFRSVRGCLDIGGEVFACVVPLHVEATLPQFAPCDIEDLPALSDIHRLSVLAIELSEIFRTELLDGPSPPFLRNVR